MCLNWEMIKVFFPPLFVYSFVDHYQRLNRSTAHVYSSRNSTVLLNGPQTRRDLRVRPSANIRTRQNPLFLETSLTLKKRTEVSSHSFLDLTESIILFFCIEIKSNIFLNLSKVNNYKKKKLIIIKYIEYIQ